MRKIRDGSFNVISQWNYGKICELVGGGEATVAKTKGELDGAIRHAMGSRHAAGDRRALPAKRHEPATGEHVRAG